MGTAQQMTLSPKGQRLVDAGARLLSESDRQTWQLWSKLHGWAPLARKEQTDDLPPDAAAVAVRALRAYATTLHARLEAGLGPDDDETHLVNNMFAAEAMSEGLART
jgi:hypothetical protein